MFRDQEERGLGVVGGTSAKKATGVSPGAKNNADRVD
jgi:hypothetical protein